MFCVYMLPYVYQWILHLLLSLLRLKVGVEDGQSEMGIPVSVEVSTNMTIAELKDKVTPSWHGNKQFM